MKRLKLNNNQYTLVDNDVYEWASKHSWYISSRGYVRRTQNYYNPKRSKTIFLHREIIKATEGIFVDHIDRNILNNQKSNLRLCSLQQNSCNRKKPKTDFKQYSQYKGVSFNKRLNKWTSYIVVNYKRIHLGYFENEFDAAITRDKAAQKYHKQFAKLNLGDKKHGSH